jgi:large subunit ribosomal protein L22
MAATAKLSNYRQAPRKVRLVADLIRGKSAAEAIATLMTLPKRASSPMEKLVRSAVANAKQAGEANPEAMVISRIEVNEAPVMKRMMPRARGRGAQILKRSSHINLTLTAAAGTKPVKAKKAPAKKAAPKKEEAVTEASAE